MDKTKGNKRWLLMIILLATGTFSMYGLPYMKSVFYEPMRAALNFSHEQYGRVLSLYGTTALIMYLPAGWLADKLNARNLLTFSYMTSGVLGLYLSTFPSYAGVQFIFIAWGVTTILTFWSAQIKIIRSLGDDSMQGKLFGLENGMEGVAGLLISFVGVGLLNVAAVQTIGMRYTLIFQSSLTIAIGLITFMLLKKNDTMDIVDEKYSFQDYVNVMKNYKVWLVGIAIFCYYTVFSSLTYLSPYLEEVFFLSAGTVAVLSALRQNGTKILAGPIFGLIGDRIGSSTKMFILGFVLVVISILGFMILPQTQSFASITVVLMLLLAFSLYGLTGIGYTPIAETGVSLAHTGAAAGLISVLGYIPDAFYYTLAGNWLDTYGNDGYRYIFVLSLACAVLGLVVSIVLTKVLKKQSLDSADMEKEAV